MNAHIAEIFVKSINSGDINTLDELNKLTPNPIPQLVTMTNRAGQTALHRTVMNGQFDSTKWLVEHGANELAKDMEGQTPLWLANFCRQSKIIQLFNGIAHEKFLGMIHPLLKEAKLINSTDKEFSVTDATHRVTLRIHGSAVIQKSNKAAKKIVLLCNPSNTEKGGALKWKSGVVLLKFNDGSLGAYNYKNRTQIRESIPKLYHLMLLANGYEERAHAEVNQRKILNWKTDTTDEVYKRDPVCERFYNLIDDYVSEQVMTAIKSIEQQENTNHKRAVRLVSLGCGQGKNLMITHHMLVRAGYSCQSVGFDLNAGNFPVSQVEQVEFIQGDMLETGKLLEPYSQDPSIKVGLFIGSLVDQCFAGTEAALNILQQARTLDIVILTGFTSVLVNKLMIKAMGWNVKVNNVTSFVDEISRHRLTLVNDKNNLDVRGFFTLTKMNPDQRKAYLLKRSSEKTPPLTTCNKLDLSMSAHPLSDLALFNHEELQGFTTIDLSWAFASKVEIENLFGLLADSKNKSRITVIVSGTEPWLADFPQNAVVDVKVRTGLGKNEVPCLSPKELAALKLEPVTLREWKSSKKK